MIPWEAVASFLISILAIIVSTGTARFVYKRKTELTNSIFKARTIRENFAQFQWIDSPITPDQIQMARAAPRRYFDEETFSQHYQDDDDAIRRYLIAFRIYHYLLYYQEFHKDVPDFFDVDLERWIREMWKSKEFCYVHERWKEYYPKFKKYIESRRPDA